MQRGLMMIGLIAAAILIGASATMNYVFASSLGKTPFEGTVLGVVSVAVDILKALLAVFVASAARTGQRMFVFVGGMAFLLFSAASMLAAAGFASQNRGAVADGRASRANQLAATERELTRAEAKLGALPTHRPASLVVEALAGASIDTRWQASKACGAPQSATQREFCRLQATLRLELMAAREAERLDALIADQRGRIERLQQVTANTADPQARLLAQAFGIDEGQVQRMLMAMIALVVEVSSGLGVYLATGHSRSDATRRSNLYPTEHPQDFATEEPPQTQTDLAASIPSAEVVIETQSTEPDRARRPVRNKPRIGIAVTPSRID